MPDAKTALQQLARLYGILPSYLDMKGQRKFASDESILAVLRALGMNLDKLEQAPRALEEKRFQDSARVMEPTIVAWGEAQPVLELRLPSPLSNLTLEARLTAENGPTAEFLINLAEARTICSQEISGQTIVTLKCPLPLKTVAGYYILEFEVAGRVWRSSLICAPSKAYAPADGSRKIWGAFLPLYALNSQRSWGAGDYSDLGSLMSWVAREGGSLVGTLPLLASFVPHINASEPYLPASKLFWSEFFLDIEAIPELSASAAARSLIEASEFQVQLAALRRSPLVDFARIWALKKQALASLADHFFTGGSQKDREFQQFLKDRKNVVAYARFRAAVETLGTNWRRWPASIRAGQIRENDVSTNLTNLFLYAQWQTERQMAALRQTAEKEKVSLYLDVPLGVHPHSYDVWHERESFVPAVTAGAPPDPVFTSGQNWTFPPLNPFQLRQSGYRYLRDTWRQQMRQAGMVRIDHQMGLHRLFWIPEGMETSQGLYVSYPAEEMYAVLALESQINRCTVVGEDLGIVPAEVRPMMDKHGIFRLFVGEYELIAENKLGAIPRQSIASLNTHDMFPFAAFWQSRDITERQRLKLIDAAGARRELEERSIARANLLAILCSQTPGDNVPADAWSVLIGLLGLLASSEAYALLVNLEDLWRETQPQNVPGLSLRQNWRRKARYTLEEIAGLSQVRETLRAVDHARKKAENAA